MKTLRAVTVCVDYADLLKRSIDHWLVGLDRLVVVTSNKDMGTQALCRLHNIECHVTDIFYANGAKFNKGAALSEAFHVGQLRLGDADWLMTFDADIIPPANWRDQLNKDELEPGVLYGSYRYQVSEDEHGKLKARASKKMPQSWVLGFFCMFHTTDPRLPSGPVFDTHWPHAGNYDTTFCRRWPKDRQTILPLQLLHQGEERANWVGRGKKKELFTDYLNHRHGHEDWEREKMNNPPTIKGI